MNIRKNKIPLKALDLLTNYSKFVCIYPALKVCALILTKLHVHIFLLHSLFHYKSRQLP